MINSIPVYKIVASLLVALSLMLLSFGGLMVENEYMRTYSEQWWFMLYGFVYGLLLFGLAALLFFKKHRFLKVLATIIFALSGISLLGVGVYGLVVDGGRGGQNFFIFSILAISIFSIHYFLWKTSIHSKVLLLDKEVAIKQTLGKPLGLLLISFVSLFLIGFIWNTIRRLDSRGVLETITNGDDFIIPMGLIGIGFFIAASFYFSKNWARWLLIVLLLGIIGLCAAGAIVEMRNLKREGFLFMLSMGSFAFLLPAAFLFLLTNKAFVMEYTDLEKEKDELLDDFLHDV